MFLAICMVDESNLALRPRTENDLLTMQAIHYENLQSRMDEARCARHDLRQCAAVLEGYLRSGNDAELRHFVAYYLKTVSAGDTLVYTQNTALNALIVYYAGLAAAKGAAFDARVEYPQSGPVSDIDLAVLFGNLLENAVEACGHLKEGSRSIRLTVRHQGDAYVILLDNTCAAPPEQEGACFRSSKRDGQLGKRIRAFRVERHVSRVKLAEKAGIEPSNISHIERDSTKVSWGILVKISNGINDAAARGDLIVLLSDLYAFDSGYGNLPTKWKTILLRDSSDSVWRVVDMGY